MNQCFVCGELITEPVSAYARNICRRCAAAPPQPPPESERKQISDSRAKEIASLFPQPQPARPARKIDKHFLRGMACLAAGLILAAHTTWVILFGGVLHSLV